MDEELNRRVVEAAQRIMATWGPMPDERLAASMALLAHEVTQAVGVPCVVYPTKIGIIAYAVPTVAQRQGKDAE